MTPKPGPDEGVLQELKRRRVVRVVIAYVALGMGAVAAVELGVALQGGPSWLFRAVLGAAALGFPVAAVLAWTYDVTPQGIVRTPESPPVEPPGEATPKWAWALTVAVGLLVAGASLVLRWALV